MTNLLNWLLWVAAPLALFFIGRLTKSGCRKCKQVENAASELRTMGDTLDRLGREMKGLARRLETP